MFTFGGGFSSSSLQGLSSGVAQALAGIAAQVQTAWGKQHAPDGSHGDVTATSVWAAGFGHASVYTHTVVTLANDVVEIPPGVSFVEFDTPIGIGSVFTLRGIRQHGVQDGQMLWLRTGRHSSYPTKIRNFSHTAEGVAPINTELAFPERQASVADSNYFVMNTVAGNSGFPRSHWVPFAYTSSGDRFVWMMWQLVSGATP